ncbi:hypothetical protein Btus_2538 [Kyrpidia tusciae DSM 2912]|uniref:Uncharacterized protein n=1 Tax=Kyrpidia tusciae (strain DSM 2912 / NBRC 15312 / T2) TaxID=562970 RepID=D5WTG1_KYRT2|nr:hypothetical protein Btus_2538 [Kyrpidia tusciae DSM 2912]
MTFRQFLLRAALLAAGWILILAPATGSRDVFDTPSRTLLMALLLGAASSLLWFALKRSVKKRRRRRRHKKNPVRRGKKTGTRTTKSRR